MNTFLRGVKGFALIAILSAGLTACASTGQTLKEAAKQPTPPVETSAAAATFEWQPTMNFMVQIDNGFDKNGVLRPDGLPTYMESSAVAQISGRCATNIQENIRKVGWVTLRETATSATSQTLGSAVGAFLGFKSPTKAIVRQVTGITAGTATGGALYGADLQLRIIISAGHAQCVMDRVYKQQALLGRVTIVMTPLLEGAAPKPLPPGTPEPTFDN